MSLFALIVGSPGVGLKYPRKHLMHTSEFVAPITSEDVPARHPVQIVMPLRFAYEYVPAAQGTHDNEPG